jgi:ribokinase
VTNVAVVGHVEWIRFAVVDRVPSAGEIVHAEQTFELAAGGGAVAAVQLRRLAGTATLHTTLGGDGEGGRALAQLRGHGLDVRASRRSRQRLGFVHLSDDHERTITVLGERHVPHGDEPLGWDDLDATDAVYFTGGDVAALRHARRARVLVATPRAFDVLREARVEVDALVASARDPGERYEPEALDPPPRLVVLTAGAQGGTWEARDGRAGAWAPAPLPGRPVDAYGCGDAFAAGLTFALGRGDGVVDAIGLAARCGAAALCGRGPYAAQLALA